MSSAGRNEADRHDAVKIFEESAWQLQESLQKLSAEKTDKKESLKAYIRENAREAVVDVSGMQVCDRNVLPPEGSVEMACRRIKDALHDTEQSVQHEFCNSLGPQRVSKLIAFRAGCKDAIRQIVVKADAYLNSPKISKVRHDAMVHMQQKIDALRASFEDKK